MSILSMVPNIRCSACGAIIGNKFIPFNMLIECGSTKLEAFQALDITRYCCRKDLANPIVLSTTVSDSNKVKMDEPLIDPGHAVEIPINNLNRLTSSVGKEIAIIPLSHSDNINDDYLETLKRELVLIEVDDIPFSKKAIDPDSVLASEIILSTSKTIVGSGFHIDRIHRTYEAI